MVKIINKSVYAFFFYLSEFTDVMEMNYSEYLLLQINKLGPNQSYSALDSIVASKEITVSIHDQ